jgi:putative hydrolase of the HAD superfamily
MIFFDIDGTLIDYKRSEYLGAIALYNEYKDWVASDEMAFYESWCQISDKHFRSYLAGEITFSEQRIKRIKEIFSFSAITLSDEEAKKRFAFYSKKYEKAGRCLMMSFHA